MRSNRRTGMLVVAVASIGLGTAAAALAQEGASSSSAAEAGMHHHYHHRHAGRFRGRGPAMPGSMLLGTTLAATHRLNLTEAQKAQIRTILKNARAEERTSRPSVDMAVLGNPGDPNYATELQNLKTHAADRIQHESDLQGQIYAVLTPQQKSELPSVLTRMKEKWGQRRASLEEHHALR